MGKENIINEDSKLVKDDLGMIEEVVELIKNLTSLESHAVASFKSTGDKRFLEAKDEYRKIRTFWLEKITKKNFGQLWCLSKHSFESMMRIDEIMTRFLSSSNFKEVDNCVNHYNAIFSWFLELNDIGKGEVSSKSEA